MSSKHGIAQLAISLEDARRKRVVIGSANDHVHREKGARWNIQSMSSMG